MLEQYIGVNINDILEYVLLGMLALIIILFILVIVQIAQNRKLKKAYRRFMAGKNGKSLEDTLGGKLAEITAISNANEQNKKALFAIRENMKITFQKLGMVKYNALHEMGGKLSFSLALLNKENDGFILNVVHSREGSYVYLKEIINGNSVIVLSEEEQEALNIALEKK